MSGYAGQVQHLAFSPDGSALASNSDDGTVILWYVSASGTFSLAPPPTGTPVPAGLFPLLFYPPLAVNYDPSIWQDASRYNSTSQMVNYLQARGLSSCTLVPEGPNGNFLTPTEAVTLGKIKFQRSAAQNNQLGTMVAQYTPAQSLPGYDTIHGLPKLDFLASQAEWEQCKALAEDVLATLHSMQ